MIVDPASLRYAGTSFGFWNAGGALATLVSGAALTGMAGGNFEWKW
jgi:hypothetical protein